jgi:AraC-like DNA-binding protein
MKSLELIAGGEKISHAALEAGYSTSSAFIAMFRKALGTTPRKYFSERGNGLEPRVDSKSR